MSIELLTKTAHELRTLLDSGQITSVELTRAYLDRIGAADDKFNHYITVTGDTALEMAKNADKMIAAGSASALTGIPIALKDVLVTEDIRTTCGSKILENFIPPYSGTAVEKLKEAGAVFLGKLNMDEFAMGSSNENSAFGPAKNPWDIERVTGGSSGGSAASVAARQAVMTLGTDTGGSIRQPAAFCGVVGMKPTYGRVSRYGLIAFASSLDQIGPFAQDVTDAAMMLGAVAGDDPRDSTTINTPVPDYVAALGKDIKGLKVGVPKEYFIDGTDPEIDKAVRDSISKLEELGAEIVEVSLPHTDYAVAVYYLIATAEASSNLARFDSVRFGLRKSEGDLISTYTATRAAGFGDEVKRRIMLGTYALSAGYYDAYYLRAQKVRRLIAEDFRKAFEKVDLLCSPVTPTTAFKLGEKTDDPLQMYLSDIFTIPLNLAGLPGLSMPCGFTSDGLPIGLQLMANHFDESTLLNTAYALEQATPWRGRLPEVL